LHYLSFRCNLVSLFEISTSWTAKCSAFFILSNQLRQRSILCNKSKIFSRFRQSFIPLLNLRLNIYVPVRNVLMLKMPWTHNLASYANFFSWTKQKANGLSQGVLNYSNSVWSYLKLLKYFLLLTTVLFSFHRQNKFFLSYFVD